MYTPIRESSTGRNLAVWTKVKLWVERVPPIGGSGAQAMASATGLATFRRRTSEADIDDESSGIA